MAGLVQTFFNNLKNVFQKTDVSVKPQINTEGSVTPPTEVETFVKPYTGKLAPVVDELRKGANEVERGIGKIATEQLAGMSQTATKVQAEGQKREGEGSRIV